MKLVYSVSQGGQINTTQALAGLELDESRLMLLRLLPPLMLVLSDYEARMHARLH